MNYFALEFNSLNNTKINELADNIIDEFKRYKKDSSKDFNIFFENIDNYKYEVFKRSNSYKKINNIESVISTIAKSKFLSDYFESKELIKNAEDSAYYRNFRDFASLEIEQNLRHLLPLKLYESLIEYLEHFNLHKAKDFKFLSSYNFLDDILYNDNLVNELINLFKSRLNINLTEYFVNEETLHRIHSFLRDNLFELLKIIPIESLKKSGISKLFKIIIGVFIYSSVNTPKNESERSEYIFNHIKIGFYWGLSYPLFDNIIDSGKVLDEAQMERINDIIIKALNGDDIEKEIPDIPFVKYFYSKLKELQQIFPKEKNIELYQILLTFHKIHLDDIKHENFEMMIKNKIIKAALARIITAYISGYKLSNEFIVDTFYIALHNQLEDDFADAIEDEKDNINTIFTQDKLNGLEYFIDYNLFLVSKYSDSNKLLNSLQDNFYEKIKLICEKYSYDEFHDFFKKYKNSLSSETYSDILHIAKKHSGINYQIEEYPLINYLDNQSIILKNQLDEFYNKYYSYKEIIDSNLPFSTQQNNPIAAAVNYALNGKSKRFRPVLTLMIADELNLNHNNLLPLIKAIEYFHTATLIFDDLPAQDNSELRRGKKALHLEYNEYTAQLSALALISEGYKNLSELNFDKQLVNEIIHYASQTCDYNGIIKGQYYDLDSRRNSNNIKPEEISILKTSLPIEFAVVAPIILSENHNLKDSAKLFARHLGIAFQIRDDINDYEKSFSSTYKTQNLDRKNNAKTFVSQYGLSKSKELFNEHLKKCKKHLNECFPTSRTLKILTLNFN